MDTQSFECRQIAHRILKPQTDNANEAREKKWTNQRLWLMIFPFCLCSSVWGVPRKTYRNRNRSVLERAMNTPKWLQKNSLEANHLFNQVRQIELEFQQLGRRFSTEVNLSVPDIYVNTRIKFSDGLCEIIWKKTNNSGEMECIFGSRCSSCLRTHSNHFCEKRGHCERKFHFGQHWRSCRPFYYYVVMLNYYLPNVDHDW